MNEAAIEHLLHQIDALSEADRRVLQQRLLGREEAAWRIATAQARAEATARGIDQQAIDRAVDAARRAS